MPPQPTALWSQRRKRGETPPDFIRRHYAAWFDNGLTREQIRHIDPALHMALLNWLRTNPMPHDMKLPTHRERIDALLAGVIAGDPDTPACGSPAAEVPKARADVLTLKPAIWGVGIDLKELGRLCLPWIRRHLRRMP